MPQEVDEKALLGDPLPIENDRLTIITDNPNFELKKSAQAKYPTGPLPAGASKALITRYFRQCRTLAFPTVAQTANPFESSRCGQATLAFLTGKSLLHLMAKFPQRLMTDEEMTGYLRSLGYIVVPLTPDITQPDEGVEIQELIKPGHVVLSRVHANRKETTWIVLWQERWYHNFKAFKANGALFMNLMPVSQYVVFHPTRWRRERYWDEYAQLIQEAGTRDEVLSAVTQFDEDEEDPLGE